jgi:hypothetical protein
MSFTEPALTSAIAECYFNPRQKSVLPSAFFDRWVSLLGPGILYVSAETFKSIIVPAWRRLDVEPEIKPANYDAMLMQERKQVRRDQPLPPEVLSSTELQPFLRLKLPPCKQILYLVFCIEMSNNTNWCILCDIGTRKCELISCVSQKIEPSVLNEIVSAARWFAFYASLTVCHPIHCFKNEIQHYYCTALSMFYTHQRICLRAPVSTVIRVLNEQHIGAFLDNFCLRDSLRRLSNVRLEGATELDTTLNIMQHLRTVARCGKRRAKLRSALLSSERKRFFTDKLNLSVEQHPTKTDLMYIVWK